MISGVIFDMDGVLMDSETAFAKLFRQLLEQLGVSCSDEELHTLGGCSERMENEFLAGKLGRPLEEVSAVKHHFFKEHPVDYGPLKKDGVDRMLDWCQENGIVCAVASSSPMHSIEKALSQGNIADRFVLVVSGQDFAESKPDPEIYNYTAGRLGFDKAGLVIIEDSPYGIEAGNRAGIFTIGLRDPNTNFDIQKADLQADSFDEIIEFLKKY